MCMGVHAIWVQVLMEASRAFHVGARGAGVTGGCELPDVRAGNQT